MHRFDHGFTLIELVIVIMIVAILSKSIFPAIFWPSTLYGEEVKHFDMEMKVQLGFFMLEKIIQAEITDFSELKNHSNGFLLSKGQKKIICDLNHKKIFFEKENGFNQEILDHIESCQIEFLHSEKEHKKFYLLRLSQGYKNQFFMFEKVVFL